jgi:4-amino-4-deoxy-L-arabinose transferase-like glycosyltransferase
VTLLRLIFFMLGVIAGVIGIVTNHFSGLIASLVFMAFAFRGLSDSPEPLDVTISTKPIWDWLQAHASFMLGLIATLCSGIAAWIALRNESSLAANYLWLASLFLIMLAALHHDRFSLVQWRATSLTLSALRRRGTALEVGLVVLVAVVAFVLRAYDLYHYPPPMHGDEGEMGLMALRILEGRNPLPLFATGWFDHPTLFHYLQAASLAIFSKTEAGLRMLSAIFGAACVLLLYWIGRVGWGQLAGIAAAWLMAVSHLHIHFSRIGLNNIESVFSMILLMLLLAKAQESGVRVRGAATPAAADASSGDGAPQEKPCSNAVHSANALSLFVGAGLVMGLSQYLYYGSRMMPVVAAPLLLFLWLEKKANVKQIFTLVLAALIAFAPLGLYYLNHPPVFLDRIQGVYIFSEANLKHFLGPNASWSNDMPALLKVQVERNLGFFVRSGDTSSFYFRDIPAFDALTSVLFWLGLGVALTRARRYHELALLLWFGLGVISAGILTIDSPNAPRLILVVPSVYLLAGLFIHRAWKLLNSTLPLRLEWVGVPVLGAAAVLTLLVNVNTYFVDYACKAPNLAPIMVAREMSINPEQYRAFLMGAPILYVEYGVIRFVARDAHARNLDSPNDLPPPNSDGKGILVVALAHRVNDLKAIETRFPGGITTSYADPLGRLIYVAYRIPPGR